MITGDTRGPRDLRDQGCLSVEHRLASEFCIAGGVLRAPLPSPRQSRGTTPRAAARAGRDTAASLRIGRVDGRRWRPRGVTTPVQWSSGCSILPRRRAPA